MFLVFYIIRFLLLPHGVRIFGTNLHRFEKFGLWCQRDLPHRLWRKGTYQQSFLGGKLGAFCGLHLIAKWSCFICPYSIFVFFFFLKKVASIESLVQSWLYGGKRSHEDGEKGLSLDYKLLYFNTFVKCYIHREIPKWGRQAIKSFTIDNYEKRMNCERYNTDIIISNIIVH